jgi:hypothetical protein
MARGHFQRLRANGRFRHGGPQRRGPLRRIVAVLRAAESIMEPSRVRLECGHEVRAWGAAKARCAACAVPESAAAPADVGAPPTAPAAQPEGTQRPLRTVVRRVGGVAFLDCGHVRNTSLYGAGAVLRCTDCALDKPPTVNVAAVLAAHPCDVGGDEE